MSETEEQKRRRRAARDRLRDAMAAAYMAGVSFPSMHDLVDRVHEEMRDEWQQERDFESRS